MFVRNTSETNEIFLSSVCWQSAKKKQTFEKANGGASFYCIEYMLKIFVSMWRTESTLWNMCSYFSVETKGQHMSRMLNENCISHQCAVAHCIVPKYIGCMEWDYHAIPVGFSVFWFFFLFFSFMLHVPQHVPLKRDQLHTYISVVIDAFNDSQRSLWSWNDCISWDEI